MIDIEKQQDIKYPYKVEEFELGNEYAVSMVRFNSLEQAKEYCRKNESNYSIYKYDEELDDHDLVCNIVNRKEITLTVENLLRQACSEDYIGTVTEEIIDDVIEDVETSADINYNENDVRFAIGRVLINRIGAKQ